MNQHHECVACMLRKQCKDAFDSHIQYCNENGLLVCNHVTNCLSCMTLAQASAETGLSKVTLSGLQSYTKTIVPPPLETVVKLAAGTSECIADIYQLLELAGYDPKSTHPKMQANLKAVKDCYHFKHSREAGSALLLERKNAPINDFFQRAREQLRESEKTYGRASQYYHSAKEKCSGSHTEGDRSAQHIAYSDASQVGVAVLLVDVFYHLRSKEEAYQMFSDLGYWNLSDKSCFYSLFAAKFLVDHYATDCPSSDLWEIYGALCNKDCIDDILSLENSCKSCDVYRKIGKN